LEIEAGTFLECGDLSRFLFRPGVSVFHAAAVRLGSFLVSRRGFNSSVGKRSTPVFGHFQRLCRLRRARRADL